MAKRCTSCGKMSDRFAEFPCVECGELIVRCYHCREIGTAYTCEKCGTEGP